MAARSFAGEHPTAADDPAVESYGRDELVVELRAQLSLFRTRVQELELENERLIFRISTCRCSKELELPIKEKDTPSLTVATLSLHSKSHAIKSRNHGSESGTVQFCSKRYIALKIMYFGQRYYGFASEAQMEPTVESEIFKALERTKLLIGSKQESHYSRCGRTDKGVSSTGQVISLFVRSNLKDTNKARPVLGEKSEIDYVRVLNRVLPKDIRVIGWSPVPPDFHARFSCLSREYKYLFWRGNLDIEKMREGASKFIGEHDFRNFCKMDANNVSNYVRNITSFDIFSNNQRSSSDELCEIRIKGSAFLWHQVRCMVSVLFMIGQGLESPIIIDELLDLKKTQRKPQYNMASELPLILRSCEFGDIINFTCSSEASRAVADHLRNEYHNYMLQASIFNEALSCLCSSEYSSTELESKKKTKHIPLLMRQTEPTYEERRAKLNSKYTI